MSASLVNHTMLTTPYPGGGGQLVAALHLLHNTGVDSTTPQPQLYHQMVQTLNLVEPTLRRMGERGLLCGS